MIRTFIFCLSLLLAVSCATRPPDNAGAPVPGFAFYEMGEFSTNRPLSTLSSTVDYKSTIRIEPAVADLAQDVLPALTPEEKQQMQNVAAMANSLSAMLNEWSRVGRNLHQTLASGRAISPEETAAIVNQLRAESKARTNLYAHLRAYAVHVATLQTGITNPADPELRKVTHEILNPLVTDPAKRPFNPDRVRDLLKAQLEQYIQDAEAVRNASARVRIQAWLKTSDKQRLPIHVINYDTIDNPLRAQEERITYGTPADRARVAEEFKTASAIADFANKAMTNSQQFQVVLDGVLKNVQRDMARLSESAKNLIHSTNDLTSLSNAIVELKAAAKPEQLPRINELEKAITNLTQLAVQVQKLPTPVVSNEDDVVQYAFKLLSAMSGVKALVLDIKWDQVMPAFADIAEIAARQSSAASPADKARLQQWVDALFPDTRDALSNFKSNFDTLQSHLIVLGAAADGSTALAAGEDLVDPRVKPHDLASAPPGYVSLIDLANRGDHVVVKTELVDANDKSLREYPPRVFDVEKFGVSDTLSANVIFADRLGVSGGAQFVAAPAVSWTLHYRQALREDACLFRRATSFLDPGIGVNVAALNFDNSGVQVGIGGHFSFFRDMFQVGGGYNLNASNNNTYIFVGIGIIESLKQAGSLMGLR